MNLITFYGPSKPLKIYKWKHFNIVYISEPETIIEIVVTYHRVKYFKTLINNDEHRLYMDLEDEKC